MSHAQRPRLMTVARSKYLMANQKNKGQRTQKRNQPKKVNPQSSYLSRRTNVMVSAPRMKNVGNSLIVTNKELHASYTSEIGSNTITRKGLNPVDSNVFPWLSAIADRYNYYRWRKLRILYTSLAPTTLPGDFTVGVFYDREDLDEWFTGSDQIRDLTQTVGSSQGPVWGSTITCHPDGSHTAEIEVIVDVDRAHMRTKWLIVGGSLSSTSLDNQAVGVFLGTVSSPNATSASYSIGRVWIDYEIEFMHPTAKTANNAGLLPALADAPDPDIRIIPVGPGGVPLPPPKPEGPVVHLRRSNGSSDLADLDREVQA
nr:MAG: hypothetical protein [Narnaviridae sp.]